MSRKDNQSRAHAIIAQRIADGELPESGRVDKVKWNFIYEGDHGLALRLQEEEFEHHFSKNREERWVMRENLKEAKVVQTEEEERLQIERMMELERMQELARRDEELARQLQEQEEQKSANRNPETEHQLQADEMLAARLEEYEKARMKRYREFRKRQIEQEDMRRAMTAVNLAGGVPPPPPVPPETPIPEEDNYDTDFTDFLSQLPEGLSAEEVKVIQELEDAALAKLLQEAESKRSGARTAVERMAYIRRRAVELRDEQLARLVQQREINRFNERRAKAMANSAVVFDATQHATSSNDPHLVPVSVPAATNANRVPSTAYTSVIRGPQMNEAYSNLNPQQQMPPQRAPPARPRAVSSSNNNIESSIYHNVRGTTSSAPPRNETFLASRGPLPRTESNTNLPPDVPPPPQSLARPPTIPDDYLTPNSLLDGTGNNGASSNSNSTVPEHTEYELPPEMNQTIEIDHAAIVASRNRRHHQQKQQKASTSAAIYQPSTNGSNAGDRRSTVVAPALPVVSPGTPPTATPPAHCQPMNSAGTPVRHSALSSPPRNGNNNNSHSDANNNNSSNEMPIPIVTNPMYIIERPLKSKKKDSDCKTQ